MSDIIEQAKHILLEPAGLSESSLSPIIGLLNGKQIDDADLYFQVSQAESWTIEDGRVKDASYSLDKGVGIRAISGEKTGFAYSDEIILPALEQAAQSARSISRSGQDKSVQAWHTKNITQSLYLPNNPLDSLSKQDKISLLQDVNAFARAQDPRIKEVVATLAGSFDVVLVMTQSGDIAADIRPLVRLNVQVIAEQNGRRESGYAGGGGRYDYALLTQLDTWQQYTKEAARLALLNLSAVDAPAGTMPVVLGSGWPGVLLHEAVGHGLEGAFTRKGSCAFSNQMNQKGASDLVTILADGTIPNRRGSLNIDDDGAQTQCTTLIEKGILKNYMQDKHNAKLMGMQSTGNGRRESYSHLPMPRMTNTYMLAGQSEPDEIIASVKNGIYAVNFAGGQVDITSGKFVFSTSEAYLIENGKITQPVKGATLIGNGPEVMKKVSMVGNDLALDQGIGVCGKNGQSVPVGVGQPTLKIDEIIVGGTHA